MRSSSAKKPRLVPARLRLYDALVFHALCVTCANGGVSSSAISQTRMLHHRRTCCSCASSTLQPKMRTSR